jgi:sigma-B regulation protein RsbU (phosphoserine phosphatase)
MTDPRHPSDEAEIEALLELRFIARADRLKLVRGSVRAAARMCGFDDGTAQNIVLAVDEACQNVIVHGYKHSADGAVVLGLFRSRDGILVRVRDFAPRVDPATVKPRDLGDVRPGKLGTYFIREIMDTVEFLPTPEGTGNLLEMTKQTGPSQ